MATATGRFALTKPESNEWIGAQGLPAFNNNFDKIDALLGAPPLDTPPLLPAQGQMYIDTGSGRLRIYIGSDWVEFRPVTEALTASDIPSISADKITSGAFHADRIPNLNASKITAGTFNTGRIPNLNASKITAGTLPIARGGTGASSASTARTALGIRFASGSVSATPSAGLGPRVNFPAGRFSSTPAVFLTVHSNTTTWTYTAHARDVSSSGFDIELREVPTGSGGDRAVMWFAIQAWA